MKNVNRRWELEAMRGVAIMGVVLIHVISMGIAVQYPDHAGWGGQMEAGVLPLVWASAWGRFSVPIFLFVSGLLITYRLKDKPISYPSLILKRGSDLLLPYLFWTVIGLLFTWFMINPWGLQHLIVALVLGKGYFHQLYFIPLLLQCIILLPLWLKGLKWNVGGFLLIIGSIQLLYTAAYQLLFLSSFEYIPASLAKAWEILIAPTLFGMMGYFVFGLAVGLHFEKCLQYVKNKSLAFCTSVYLASLVLQLADVHLSFSISSDLGNSIHFYRVTVFIYVCSTILLVWKCALVFGEARWMRSVMNLGQYAFFIFLAHVLILESLDLHSSVWYGSYAMIIVTTVLTMLLCIGVQYIGNKLAPRRSVRSPMGMFFGK
ncbi:acyltransferase [Paenibacillus agilis]|uniref:Acyltransferase n=1 Tax=Paenibacillus agilis TaxID=3020863 RepID=A0A559IVZ1_9BACL|nr:acyltransferase [Paenibacillus agilis]TVX91784.1 acyltransferase [Paenibacillus agilis]